METHYPQRSRTGTALLLHLSLIHILASVTRAINRIDGAAAKVSLKKGEAVVSYDREISNEELKKVVEDRGYHVVSIQ